MKHTQRSQHPMIPRAGILALALGLSTLPFAPLGAQTRVVQMNAARERKRHANGRIGHLFGAVIGHVRHGDAPLPGKDPIDIIETHAAAHDELAARQAFDGADRIRPNRNQIAQDPVAIYPTLCCNVGKDSIQRD